MVAAVKAVPRSREVCSILKRGLFITVIVALFALPLLAQERATDFSVSLADAVKHDQQRPSYTQAALWYDVVNQQFHGLLNQVDVMLCASGGNTPNCGASSHGSNLQAGDGSGNFVDSGLSPPSVATAVTQAAAAAQKYVCADGNVLYVDALHGSDSNDGCSAGTALLYLSTAWGKMYLANSGCNGRGCGGTIYTTDDSGKGTIYWDSGHNTARIIGPNDPNANWGVLCGQFGVSATCSIGGKTWYSQLPSVQVICVGGGLAPGNVAPSGCNYGFGASGDTTGGFNVGLVLSGVDSNMLFNGIGIQSAKVPIAFGLDSNGSLGDNANTSGIYFDNYNFVPRNNNNPGVGPGVLVGSEVFEVYFYRGFIAGNFVENVAVTSCTRATNVVTCTVPNNSTLQNGDLFYMRGQSDGTFQAMGNMTVDSSTQFHFSQPGPAATATGGHVFTCRSAAICGEPNGNDQGAITIMGDAHISGGGFMYAGDGNSVFIDYVDHVVSEGLPNDAAFFAINGVNAGQVTLMGFTDIQIADNGSNTTELQTFARAAGFTSKAQTPSTISSETEGSLFNTMFEPSRRIGFEGTKVVAEWEGLLRGAVPMNSQFSQYAIGGSNPSGWTSGGSITTELGPDGFNDAGTATQDIIFGQTGGITVADGDVLLAFGMWKAPSGVSNGGSNGKGTPPYPFYAVFGSGCSGAFLEDVTGDMSALGQGPGSMPFGANPAGNVPQWNRGFGVFIVHGTGTCSSLQVGAAADSSHPIHLYMSGVFYVPASASVSLSELAAFAYYGGAANAGTPNSGAWTPATLSARRLGVVTKSTFGVGATALTTGDFVLTGWGSGASIAGTYTYSKGSDGLATSSSTTNVTTVSVHTGDVIIEFVASDGNLFSSLADSCGNTWIQLVGTSSTYTQVLYAISNCTNASDTVTLTYASSPSGARVYTRVETGSPANVAVSVTAFSTIFATPTLTVSQAYTLSRPNGELVLVGIMYGNNGAHYNSNGSLTGASVGSDVYAGETAITSSATETGNMFTTNAFGNSFNLIVIAPTVDPPQGTDQGFKATVIAGTGPTSNPSVNLTFHDGAWPNAPTFACNNTSGGTGTPSLWLVDATPTNLTATYVGTPSASALYPITCVGVGR